MKVMNGLVITLEKSHKRFLYVCLFYYVSNFADSRTEVPRYWSSQSYFIRSFFCLSVFRCSEVLGKITSIRSKLPTAACWSREEKRGNCVNLLCLLYVESDFGTTDTTDKSFRVVFPRWGFNLIVDSKSQPAKVDSSTIELHAPSRRKKSLNHNPLQKREETGASFLYWLDWESKH